jgi:arylsulfatase A-like enzyme
MRAIALGLLLLGGMGWGERALLAEEARPKNIIFILADDVGWGDLGCYGAKKIRTPNLDALAKEGMRFTDVHSVGPLCSATRYGLFSGEYNFRSKYNPIVISPVQPLTLDVMRPTLASIVKAGGYETALIGKWHLGLGSEPSGPDYNVDLKPGPLEIGFDSFYGIATTNDRTPCVLIENHRVIGLDPADPISVSMKPQEGYDNLIGGIYRHTWQKGGKAALWKDEDLADQFVARAVSFIDAHKSKPFFLFFSAHDIHHPSIPHSRFWKTSEAGPRGDMMHEMDFCVGEIMKALAKNGLTEETLVIYTSDNGGVIDNQFRKLDPTWDSEYPATEEESHPFNGPWRGRKGSQYEGGHRVPFIASWPKRIAKGKESDAMFSLVDMPATFAALLGQKLGPEAAVDSHNALAVMLDGKSDPPVRDHLIASGPGLSIRAGGWKLIAPPRGQSELFHYAEDPYEKVNLAAKEPEKVKEMQELLAAKKRAKRTAP